MSFKSDAARNLLNFVFDYVNDREPMLVAKAITAYYNQKVTAESDGEGGE